MAYTFPQDIYRQLLGTDFRLLDELRFLAKQPEGPETLGDDIRQDPTRPSPYSHLRKRADVTLRRHILTEPAEESAEEAEKPVNATVKQILLDDAKACLSLVLILDNPIAHGQPRLRPANYCQPFFSVVQLLGMNIFADPTLLHLYAKAEQQALEGNLAADDIMKGVARVSSSMVGSGRTKQQLAEAEKKLRQEKRREQTRARVQNVRRRTQESQERLRAAIDARIQREIPPAREQALLKTRSLRREKARIARAVLTEAQQSDDTATKRTATALLQRMDKATPHTSQ